METTMTFPSNTSWFDLWAEHRGTERAEACLRYLAAEAAKAAAKEYDRASKAELEEFAIACLDATDCNDDDDITAMAQDVEYILCKWAAEEDHHEAAYRYEMAMRRDWDNDPELGDYKGWISDRVDAIAKQAGWSA
jgi:hypothetical protein